MMMCITRRTALGTVLAATMVAVACAALTTPASASPAPLVLVNCVGTNHQHFEPGLTNEEQEVIMSGTDHATCSSLTNPDLRSFVGPFSGPSRLSCTSLLGGGTGTQTIYWNNSSAPADTSVWEYTNSYNNVNGNNIGVATGPITSGPLTGATLTQTISVPQASLAACTQPGGMTDNSGPSTWIFTGV